MKKHVFYTLLAGSFIFTACNSSYSLVSVEGGRVPITSVYDEQQDQAAWRILQPYRAKIDSLMTPVIGHSARKLEAYRPESPLSNLMADILCEGAKRKLGISVDVGVMNVGGIRNILNEGDITFGSIYEISPFQNALSVVVLRGEDLLELFQQIAAVHGEGLSGARLVISKDGRLLRAEVGGKPVDPAKEYRVATIDYLAEGNDRMEAFKKATSRTEPQDAVLRDLFIDYVKQCEAKGVFVNAEIEGRIVEQ